jgi:hypothetical protein
MRVQSVSRGKPQMERDSCDPQAVSSSRLLINGRELFLRPAIKTAFPYRSHFVSLPPPHAGWLAIHHRRLLCGMRQAACHAPSMCRVMKQKLYPPRYRVAVERRPQACQPLGARHVTRSSVESRTPAFMRGLAKRLAQRKFLTTGPGTFPGSSVSGYKHVRAPP